jgi:carboxyl-terminal processing protease
MLKYLLILLIALSATVQAASLTPAQRAMIWTEAWSAINDHFVGFDRIPQVKWQDSLQSVLNELLVPTSEVDFWRLLRTKITALNDGQTELILPVVLPREYDTVPIRMMITDKKVLVKRLSSSPAVQKSGIKVGDELLSLNGIPVFEVLETECIPHVSGSTLHGRLAQAVYRVLTGKADTDVKLAMQRPNGEKYEVTLKRVSNDTGNYYSELNEATGMMYNMVTKNILYYRIDSFKQWEIEKDLLGILAANPQTKDLILDLRANHTGLVPQELIARFAFFPLPMGACKEVVWKSEPSPKEGGTNELVRDMRSVDARMIQPADSVFKGRIVVLVSAETAGAAEQFLEPLVFASRVTLIGDTTAGAGGTAVDIVFPTGGILSLTSQQPVWEKGYGNGKGFPPDLRVIPTATGLASGKDEVLNAAIQFLEKKK